MFILGLTGYKQLYMKKYILTIICFLFFSSLMFGQKAENRIYVVDWTQSMIGYKGRTPDIWDQVRKILIESIEEIDEESTSVTLFCFSDKIEASFDKKDEILHFLNNGKKRPSGMKTNLSLPWREALAKIKPNRYNFITFITDGAEQNVQQEVPFHTEILNGKWNEILQENEAYLCFVQLSNLPMDPLVADALTNSENILVLDEIQFPTIIRLLDTKKQYKFNLTESTEFFISLPIDIINKQGFNQNIKFEFVPSKSLLGLLNTREITLDANSNKISLPLYTDLGDEELSSKSEYINGFVRLKSNDPMTIFPNQAISLVFNNKREKNVQIEEHIVKTNTSHYPGFWFSEASSVPLTIQLQIQPGKYTKEKVAILSSVKLYDSKKEEEISSSLYRIAIADSTVDNPFLIDTYEKDIVLKLYLDDNIKRGKYRLRIDYSANQLDNIYPDEVLEIDFKHSVTWNPLKLGVVLLAGFIIVLFLAWKLIFIYLAYPRIKKVNLLICKTPHMLKDLRIKDARKVVLTSSQQKQSWINKFFTGKILFLNCGSSIISPISIYPQRNKKYPLKIKATNLQDYSGLRLAANRGETLLFTNTRKEKIELKFR